MNNWKFNRIIVILSIAALAVSAYSMYLSYRQWDFDDSYIVYRIAKNILNGHGWVYNIGEAHNPSTSVLNTLLIAIFSYFTTDIPFSAHIIDTLAIFLSAIFAFLLFRKWFGDIIGLLTGFFLINQMGTNGTWGVESSIFICLALCFVFFEEHHKFSWPILGFLILARPDGIVLAGLKWLKTFYTDKSWSVKGLFVIGVILLPWVIFSLYMFHQFFPDTLSQKIWQGYSGFWGTGPVYLKGLVRHYVYSSTILFKGYIILSGIGFYLMLRRKTYFLYFVGFALLQQVSYIFLNVPLYHWYLSLIDVALLMSLMYLVGYVLTAAYRKYRNGSSLPAQLTGLYINHKQFLSFGFTVIMFAVAIFSLSSAKRNQHVSKRSIAYTGTIKKIDSLFPSGRLAVTEAGTVGFHSERFIIDICGLTLASGQFLTNDRMDVFYHDPPELVLLHNPVWGHEAAIRNDYRFSVVYESAMYFDDSAMPMQLFKRKENIDLSKVEEELPKIYPAFVQDARFTDDKLKTMTKKEAYLDLASGTKIREKHFYIQNSPVLYLTGWAVATTNSNLPPVFILLINEHKQKFSLPARRTPRNDIAEKFKNPQFRMAGFEVQGLTKSLPVGLYRVLIVQDFDSSYYYAEAKYRIYIPDSPRNNKDAGNGN